MVYKVKVLAKNTQPIMRYCKVGNRLTADENMSDNGFIMYVT